MSIIAGTERPDLPDSHYIDNRVFTDENIFAGSREDILRRVDGAWKIAKRIIVLDSNVILAKNLSVFF